jgi:Glycosyl transferase 4-like domain
MAATGHTASVRNSVVLIAYHFPPDPAVGSLRAANVARAFRDAGYRVDVVTARLSGETGTRSTQDPGLVVHPVTVLPGPGDVCTRLKAWMLAKRRRSPESTDGSGRSTWTPPTQVAAWKRLLLALLHLPDDQQGFVLPAWRRARKLVRTGARLVYSTGPPYSPHLVGLALRSIRGIRWIMELRDPWTGSDHKPWWVRTRATDALDARLERLCLKRADLVVAVSEGIRNRLASRMPARSSSRLLVVRNGIEHLVSSAAPERRPGPVRIVYTGTIYWNRDPRPFLRGLAAMFRKKQMDPEQVAVSFIGECRSIGTVSMEKEIDTLGLTDVVRVQDQLPHAAVKAIIEEADALLLLAQQQPDQVPNKLYEYLGTRRPILAFADADGETARMLRQVGGHYVVTGDDEEEVERALAEMLISAPRGDGAKTDDMVLKEWTTEVQMKKLLQAVRSESGDF